MIISIREQQRKRQARQALRRAATWLIFPVIAMAGYSLGTWDKRAAVEAEYVRVVSSIARTMRCQTEEEFDQGLDHECDPSEIEQDAGLR